MPPTIQTKSELHLNRSPSNIRYWSCIPLYIYSTRPQSSLQTSFTVLISAQNINNGVRKTIYGVVHTLFLREQGYFLTQDLVCCIPQAHLKIRSGGIAGMHAASCPIRGCGLTF